VFLISWIEQNQALNHEKTTCVSLLSDDFATGFQPSAESKNFPRQGQPSRPPPGILVIGVVSFIGGGIGSLVGAVASRQFILDPNNQEGDARKKLKKYALLLQKPPTATIP